MNKKELRDRIASLCTHILFEYAGKNCGIDPFSLNEIDVWFGKQDVTCHSVDEVMSVPLFDGKSLEEIAEEIEEE